MQFILLDLEVEKTQEWACQFVQFANTYKKELLKNILVINNNTAEYAQLYVTWMDFLYVWCLERNV